MTKIALFVIYNHRYDKNIPKVENLYKGKFSHIYHLVPFYEGEQENVLPVYESSYQFQSYISQAYQQIRKRHEQYTHYFVVSDDALMNPSINETNLFEFLNIDEQTCYIKNFSDIRQKLPWSQVYVPLLYRVKQKGVEVVDILPDYQQASLKFKQHNLDIPDKVKYSRLWLYVLWYLWMLWARNVIRSLKMAIKYTFRRRKIAYPLVWGGSDYLLMPSFVMPKFCTYCGAFAATGLFVEYAIPTALVFSANKIATEQMIGKQAIFNDEKKIREFENTYNFNLEQLIRNFPEKVTFIHPVKLSKWK
jgi:hypothetical protein